MEHNIENLSENIIINGEQASFEIPFINDIFFHEVSDQIKDNFQLAKLKGKYSLFFTSDVIKFNYSFASGESSKTVNSALEVALDVLSIVYRNDKAVTIKF